ncbi:hypothetical protein [uncultured Helicobacter sp.]|uniref:hypothetical protein n=1 Tax=uncultured Helicobacter sp. TaxID=175537 RepID=UPI0026314784|nr:hypothetical protein [uncultured Helicobacter sp.]
MKIKKEILIENFEDYENHQSELIGSRFECQGFIYDISYAEFMDCPFDESEIIF